MTRVLSVIHYPTFGGPHNQVLRLAAPLQERGFKTLALLPDEPGNAFERLANAGVSVEVMPLGRLREKLDWTVQRKSLGTIAGDVPRLTRLIRREQVDLVVLHGSLNLQAAVAARRSGIPAVVQVLDMRTPRIVRLLSAPLIRSLATTAMTTGETVALAHPGLPRDPSRLFPFFPPVDTRLFAPDRNERGAIRAALGFDHDDIVVGCVANLIPQKNLEMFVEVAEYVSTAVPGVRFALLGASLDTHKEYAERVLKRASGLRAKGSLVVRDVGADVPRYLRGLDVFLATSRSEGISTTILEAMSIGIPVVSTDVGGIREAVLNGTTGYLASPSDTAALVEYVVRLASNPSERAAMARAARERAIREFDVERCADVHARAFRAALARAPGRRDTDVSQEAPDG